MIIENSVLTPYELAITEKANKEAAFDNFRNTWFPSQLTSINEQLEYASKIGNNSITLSVPKTLNNYTFLQKEIEPMLIDLFNYVYNIELKEETNTFVATISWDDNDTVRPITIEGSEVTFTLESDSEVVFCPEDTERILSLKDWNFISNNTNYFVENITGDRLKFTLYGFVPGDTLSIHFLNHITNEKISLDVAFSNHEDNVFILPDDIISEENKKLYEEYYAELSVVTNLNMKIESWGPCVYRFNPNLSNPHIAPYDFVPEDESFPPLKDVWEKNNKFTLQLKERDPSDINYGKETTLYIYNKNETSTN